MFVLYDKTLYNGEERGYFDKDRFPHWTDFNGAYAYDEFDEAQADATFWNEADGYSLEVIEVE